MPASKLDEALLLVPGLVAILRGESDRGCVILAASLLEDELESHLLRRLVPKSKATDELFAREARAPISAFSDKINLAFRVGLITKSERTIYHQLRELRNACAHNITTQAFSENHFRDRMANMIDESKELWAALHASIAGKIGPARAPSSVRDLVNLITWRIAFEFFFALVIAEKRVQLITVHQLPELGAA